MTPPGVLQRQWAGFTYFNSLNSLGCKSVFSFYRVWHNWWPVKKIVFWVSDDVSTKCNYVRQTARWMLFFWLSMLSFKSKEAFQVIKITFLLSWSMTPVMQHFTFIWDCKTYLRACVNKIIHTRPHILFKKNLLACLSIGKSCYHSWSEDVTFID